MNGPHESHELAGPEKLPDQPMESDFRDFLVSHKAEFLRIAISHLRNLFDADEAVLDAALKMHSKWPKIQSHANPLAFARKMVHNASVDFYRRRARLANHEVPHSGLPHTPTADDLLELRGYDRLDQARAILQDRAPKQAECVRLRYIEGMEFAEIAGHLDITPGAVKTNIHLGLKALQALMDPPELGKGGDS
ncbi:RNA polymerase sigma factor [Streptomyces atratus]|uniref:RNA polymerase sigma factor n=1 Tax=Streptomyces atratus TaxID=1893 RepID=UPI00225B7C1E|nr:RNA polymerase sigma factor [Streptomyces atratus]MCX5346075.1 RNA polymerase sigma factor [Streptomyces atratus]